MAIASVSCASWLIEPYDIAPVANRLTMDSTGSTSSIGTGVAAVVELEQAAQRAQPPALVVHEPWRTAGRWRTARSASRAAA